MVFEGRKVLIDPRNDGRAPLDEGARVTKQFGQNVGFGLYLSLEVCGSGDCL